VKTKKRVLIVTDGAAPVLELADRIAKLMTEELVVVKTAPDFTGADILPADICLFGCETPHPVSFSHLEELLLHINLVGRPCGLFSPASTGAVTYLSGIVRDSELSVREPPLTAPSPEDVKRWVKSLVK
jgi:hypothetical protein